MPDRNGIPSASEEALQQPAFDPIVALAAMLSGGMVYGGMDGAGLYGKRFLINNLLGNAMNPKHPTSNNMMALLPALPSLNYSEALRPGSFQHGTASFAEDAGEEVRRGMSAMKIYDYLTKGKSPGSKPMQPQATVGSYLTTPEGQQIMRGLGSTDQVI